MKKEDATRASGVEKEKQFKINASAVIYNIRELNEDSDINDFGCLLNAGSFSAHSEGFRWNIRKCLLIA